MSFRGHVSYSCCVLEYPPALMGAYMQKRNFICIYCGNRKPWEVRTEEHFIPQYIYGTFSIREVCGDCNSKMGALVDSAFPRYIRFAEYFKTGIIHTNGTATLEDGSKVEGMVKIIEQRIKSRPYSIRGFISSDGKKIQTHDIAHVRFLAMDPMDTDVVSPGIAKVAYASIHYLLNYRDRKFRYLNFVNSPHLGRLRLFFNANAIRYIGKKYKGFSIQLMTHEERVKILQGFSSPEIRRHFIHLRQDGKDIEVSIVLLSQEFWKVRIYDHSLPIKAMVAQDESLMPELDPIRPLPSEPVNKEPGAIYINVANPSFRRR